MAKQLANMEGNPSDIHNLDEIFINLFKIVKLNESELTTNQIEVFEKGIDYISKVNKEILNKPHPRETLGKFTLLHYASMKDNEKLALLLIKKGVDVNVRDGNMCTPLYYAFGSKAIVELLLDAGADVNAINSNQNTPLHFLCINIYSLHSSSNNDSKLNEYKAIAKILIEHGANIHANDRFRLTPLYWLNNDMSKELREELISYSQRSKFVPKGNPPSSRSEPNSDNKLEDNSASKYKRGKNIFERIIEWIKESISAFIDKSINLLRSLFKTKSVTRSKNISESVRNISGSFNSNRANNMSNNQPKSRKIRQTSIN